MFPRKVWLVGLMVLGVFLVAGLSAGGAGAAVVSLEEPGKLCAVRRGDSITLELSENPSTGYLWQMTASDATILEIVQDEYVAPDNGDSPLLGAAGTHRYRFRAAKAGTATLTLVLCRAWEGIDNAAETRVYTIKVD